MGTRVRVITEAAPAIVLSYPRDADPVFGEELTEVAQLPPQFEQEFTLDAGFDLLVAEMPVLPGAVAVTAVDAVAGQEAA
jgi:hypothetical protein